MRFRKEQKDEVEEWQNDGQKDKTKHTTVIANSSTKKSI